MKKTIFSIILASSILLVTACAPATTPSHIATPEPGMTALPLATTPPDTAAPVASQVASTGNGIVYGFDNAKVPALAAAPLKVTVNGVTKYIALDKIYNVNGCSLSLSYIALDDNVVIEVSDQKIYSLALAEILRKVDLTAPVHPGYASTLKTTQTVNGKPALIAFGTVTVENNKSTTSTVYNRYFTNDRALMYMQSCDHSHSIDIQNSIAIALK